MEAVRVRRSQSKCELTEQVLERLVLAQAAGLIKPDIEPQLVAMGLWALMDGLIRNWMFEPSAFSLIDLGDKMIGTMLEGIRTR